MLGLGPAEGLEGIDSFVFPKPFGNGFFDFACAWAVSQPAKSGSPPSSKAAGFVGLRGFRVDDCSAGASKKESSSILPQASSISSSSKVGWPKYCSLEVRVKLGVVGRLRFDFSVTLAVALLGVEALGGGNEVDRVSFGFAARPFVLGCISPFAVVILFVKDEMAQPAHDVSFCVPILVADAVGMSVDPGGGRTVSGRVVPYLRTR